LLLIRPFLLLWSVSTLLASLLLWAGLLLWLFPLRRWLSLIGIGVGSSLLLWLPITFGSWLPLIGIRPALLLWFTALLPTLTLWFWGSFSCRCTYFSDWGDQFMFQLMSTYWAVVMVCEPSS
jgi:hypothetical protein